MKDIQTYLDGLILSRPNPDRDAPFAIRWFNSPGGKETLMLMGNPAHTIKDPTLSEEMDRMREFLRLEKTDEQLTWMIRYNNATIGAVWIEKSDTQFVTAPAVHIMIGDPAYRGRGIGTVVFQEMIRYAKDTLKTNVLYSRHLVSNIAIAHLSGSLGFVKDGAPYTDSDGLEFQNTSLDLHETT